MRRALRGGSTEPGTSPNSHTETPTRMSEQIDKAKAGIIAEHRLHDTDTGSPEVQIAHPHRSASTTSTTTCRSTRRTTTAGEAC